MIYVLRCPWCGACSTNIERKMSGFAVCAECGTKHLLHYNLFRVPERSMTMNNKNKDRYPR